MQKLQDIDLDLGRSASVLMPGAGPRGLKAFPAGTDWKKVSYDLYPLPPGLILGGKRRLEGIPREAGEWVVQYRARLAGGRPVELGECTIRVAEAPEKPKESDPPEAPKEAASARFPGNADPRLRDLACVASEELAIDLPTAGPEGLGRLEFEPELEAALNRGYRVYPLPRGLRFDPLALRISGRPRSPGRKRARYFVNVGIRQHHLGSFVIDVARELDLWRSHGTAGILRAGVDSQLYVDVAGGRGPWRVEYLGGIEGTEPSEHEVRAEDYHAVSSYRVKVPVTPAAEGRASARLRVTDSGGRQAEREIAVRVVPPVSLDIDVPEEISFWIGEAGTKRLPVVSGGAGNPWSRFMMLDGRSLTGVLEHDRRAGRLHYTGRAEMRRSGGGFSSARGVPLPPQLRCWFIYGDAAQTASEKVPVTVRFRR